MSTFRKLKATAFLPLLPVVFLIDVVVGDYITGVKTTAWGKLREHKTMWLSMWDTP